MRLIIYRDDLAPFPLSTLAFLARLHLIDFEQLKIENQTLNEKIEERNEELLKLRKKTTTTVQVLTCGYPTAAAHYLPPSRKLGLDPPQGEAAICASRKSSAEA